MTAPSCSSSATAASMLVPAGYMYPNAGYRRLLSLARMLGSLRGRPKELSVTLMAKVSARVARISHMTSAVSPPRPAQYLGSGGGMRG